MKNACQMHISAAHCFADGDLCLFHGDDASLRGSRSAKESKFTTLALFKLTWGKQNTPDGDCCALTVTYCLAVTECHESCSTTAHQCYSLGQIVRRPFDVWNLAVGIHLLDERAWSQRQRSHLRAGLINVELGAWSSTLAGVLLVKGIAL